MNARRGALVLLLCLGASAAVLWPLPFSPHPHDHADTLFNTWLLAWSHHALTSFGNPVATPQFAGFPDGQGRNDMLLTQWAASLPLRVLVGNPVRIHNLLMWISLALSGFAAALLARDRGASTGGAAFAGTAFICLPYFQSHLWHLQLQSAGLTVAGLLYALRLAEGRGRGWPLVPLILLQGLASLYHWYFLNLALLVIIVQTLFTAERSASARLLLRTVLGNILMLPFLVPQLRNAAHWSIDTIASTDLASFVSPWHTSFIAGWLRSSHAHPEAALWPGLAVLAGAVWAATDRRAKGERALLILGVFFACYSLGPTISAWGAQLAPGPFRLMAALPGGTAVRLPARSGYLALLPLLVHASKKLGERPLWAAAGIVMALGEALHPGVHTLPAGIPEFHGWIREQKPARVLYLPMVPDLDNPGQEAQRLFGGTLHFTPSINGYSTSLPEGYQEAAHILNTWPSAQAAELAERLGVDLVIFEGEVPEDADMHWFDGRLRTGAVWLNR